MPFFFYLLTFPITSNRFSRVFYMGSVYQMPHHSGFYPGAHSPGVPASGSNLAWPPSRPEAQLLHCVHLSFPPSNSLSPSCVGSCLQIPSFILGLFLHFGHRNVSSSGKMINTLPCIQNNFVLLQHLAILAGYRILKLKTILA